MSDFNAFGVIPARLRDYHVHDMDNFMARFPHGVDTQTSGNFSLGVRRVLSALARLYSGRSMSELCKAMPEFSKDLVWSDAITLMSRKGHVRVSHYLEKFFLDAELEPHMVKVHGPMPGDRYLVEVAATVWIKPHRTWLLLPTLLLPKAVPLIKEFKIGVNGPLESGQIEIVHARLANLPALPLPVRAYLGVVFGWLPHLTEPAWGLGMELLGDSWYADKRRRIAHETIDTANDYGHAAYYTLYDVYRKATDMVGQAGERTVEAGRQTYNRVAATAEPVLSSAKDSAARVYDTAAVNARRTYETAAEGARQTYDTAAVESTKTAERARITAPAGYEDLTGGLIAPATGTHVPLHNRA